VRDGSPESTVPPSAPLSQTELGVERTVLEGIAGSEGVAIGRALVVQGRRTTFLRRTIEASEIETELARVREAAIRAQRGIREAAHGMPQSSRTALPVLEAYLLMLEDPMLHERVERKIRRDRKCAEWAVQEARDDLGRLFASPDTPTKDAYIAERVHDVEFVCDRLLRALVDDAHTLLSSADTGRLAEPMIVFARDLSPADTAGMAKEPVLAFVTEVGSRTSHTSIMARALEIPSVVGVKDATRFVRTGDRVVVCGLTGTVTIHPTPEDVSHAEAKRLRHRARQDRLFADASRLARTISGERVHLSANLELPEEAAFARKAGAETVGLYRTEFLFVDRADLPSENEQYEAYASIVQAFGGATVTLRTFDIGGDKFASSFELPPEMNPALGLRAIRLALAQPEVFSTQLRAMVRAARHGNVRIMLPMISTTDEIAAARALLARAEADVARSFGKRVDPIPLGAMIEVPAAAVMADVLARHADFFSIGTNDLVQYALAVDRTSRTLAHLASPLSPAILRLCAMAIRAANAAKIPVSVCGTMASDPLHALLLVGLGVRELSMEASAIPVVREAISRASMAELARIAELCLEAETEARVREAVSSSLGPRLLDLDAVRDGA
jgi:phosphotransferase system enzyme I (PtsI)